MFACGGQSYREGEDVVVVMVGEETTLTFTCVAGWKREGCVLG